MSKLTLTFLGSFQAHLDDATITTFRSVKVQALLAYLAVESKKAHSRDALTGLLWPDQPLDVARTNLRQSLSRLQKSINNRKEDPPFLFISRDSIQFNRESDNHIDVAAFLAALSGCTDHSQALEPDCTNCIAQAETAVHSYGGDFLAHFFVSDSSQFEEWMLQVRAQLHQAVISRLHLVADYYERRGEYETAQSYAARLLELEPWLEQAHQQLMRLYARQGKRGKALHQYAQCVQILDAELGVSPTAATTALVEQIRGIAQQRAHNLPSQTKTFVGRDEELAQLKSLLADPDKRLVTLIGPGGIGKTTLCLQVGQQIADDHFGPFMHGVFFVPLAGVNAVDYLATAVAEALQISLVGRHPVEAQLFAALESQELLLILDNYEHLIDGGSRLLARIMEKAPQVTLLVTSREKLNLGGEWVYSLDGLGFAAQDRLHNQPLLVPLTQINWAQPGSAVTLFLQRAEQVNAAFWVRGDAAAEAAVLRICQLTEGLPLALELAAAWANMLTAPEIVQEIEQSLDILVTGQQGMEPRHRSLRAVFDHSWQLLTTKEQQVLQNLSVFRGGFTREAAKEVAGATLFQLQRLLQKSLLYRDEDGRFFLHELLRQFTVDLLNEKATTAVAVSQKHATYFGQLLQKAEQNDWSGTYAIDLVRLEIDNIRTSWRWAATETEIPILERFLHPLLSFYVLTNWFLEGERLFSLACQLLAPQITAVDLAHKVAFAKILARQFYFGKLIGKLDNDISQAEQAAFLLQENEQFAEASFFYESIGLLYFDQGEFQKAHLFLRQSLDNAIKSADEDRQANLCLHLCAVSHLMGNLQELSHWSQVSHELYSEMGSEWGIAHALRWQGVFHHAEAAHEAALDLYQQSLAIFQKVDHASSVANCLNSIGQLLQDLGRHAEAKAHYEQSLQIFTEYNYETGLIDTLNNLGNISNLLHDYNAAENYYLQALEKAVAMKAAPMALQTLSGTASLLLNINMEKNNEVVQSNETALSRNALGKAFELFDVVANHPASYFQTRQTAQTRLDQMVRQLPAATIEKFEAQVAEKKVAAALTTMLASGQGSLRLLQEVIEE